MALCLMVVCSLMFSVIGAPKNYLFFLLCWVWGFGGGGRCWWFIGLGFFVADEIQMQAEAFP